MSGAVENGLYEVAGVGDRNIMWGLDRVCGGEGFPFWETISVLPLVCEVGESSFRRSFARARAGADFVNQAVYVLFADALAIGLGAAIGVDVVPRA